MLPSSVSVPLYGIGSNRIQRQIEYNSAQVHERYPNFVLVDFYRHEKNIWGIFVDKDRLKR